MKYPYIQRRYAVFAVSALLLFVGIGCSEDSTATAPSFYKVTYSVSVLGNLSEVLQVTYADTTGPKTVDNPKDDWSVTTYLSSGKAAGVTANSVVIGGAVGLHMVAEAGNASSLICDNIPSGTCRVLRDELCENPGAVPDTCSLDIAPVQLP